MEIYLYYTHVPNSPRRLKAAPVILVLIVVVEWDMAKLLAPPTSGNITTILHSDLGEFDHSE